jgi:hypothetical protein
MPRTYNVAKAFVLKGIFTFAERRPRANIIKNHYNFVPTKDKITFWFYKSSLSYKSRTCIWIFGLNVPEKIKANEEKRRFDENEITVVARSD